MKARKLRRAQPDRIKRDNSWRGERQRVARFTRNAEGVLREHIERALVDGKSPDEVRLVARQLRVTFRLPIPDGALESMLWKAVLEKRPELLPEDEAAAGGDRPEAGEVKS